MGYPQNLWKTPLITTNYHDQSPPNSGWAFWLVKSHTDFGGLKNHHINRGDFQLKRGWNGWNGWNPKVLLFNQWKISIVSHFFWWIPGFPTFLSIRWGDAKHKAQCFNAQKDDGRGEKPSGFLGITVPFLGKNHDDVGLGDFYNSENQGLWGIWWNLSVSMFGFQHCSQGDLPHTGSRGPRGLTQHGHRYRKLGVEGSVSFWL